MFEFFSSHFINSQTSFYFSSDVYDLLHRGEYKLCDDIFQSSDKNIINNLRKTTLYSHNQTLLMEACLYNNIEVVKYLMTKQNLDVFAVNNNGDNALHSNAHWLAHKGNNIQISELLLNKYPSLINTKDEYGDTPLYHASRIFKKDHVIFFIERGANVDATNNKGEKPDEQRHDYDDSLTVEPSIVEIIELHRKK